MFRVRGGRGEKGGEIKMREEERQREARRTEERKREEQEKVTKIEMKGFTNTLSERGRRRQTDRIRGRKK